MDSSGPAGRGREVYMERKVVRPSNGDSGQLVGEVGKCRRPEGGVKVDEGVSRLAHESQIEETRVVELCRFRR